MHRRVEKVMLSLCTDWMVEAGMIDKRRYTRGLRVELVSKPIRANPGWHVNYPSHWSVFSAFRCGKWDR